MAGQSQPRTASLGKVATNSPRQSNSSPVALTAAMASAVATRVGSAPGSAGSSSVPTAPSGGSSSAAPPSQRGRAVDPEAHAAGPRCGSGQARPRGAGSSRPSRWRTRSGSCPSTQPAGQHGEQHPHARRDDQGDGQGQRSCCPAPRPQVRRLHLATTGAGSHRPGHAASSRWPEAAGAWPDRTPSTAAPGPRCGRRPGCSWPGDPTTETP